MTWRHSFLAWFLACAIAGCGGGGSDVAGSEAPAPLDVETTHAANVTLAAPESVPNSNRIALRWTARGNGRTFSVLLQRSERDHFDIVAHDVRGGATIIERGPAWTLDFPTARVKVRACNRGGLHCVDSNAQPLLTALMQGVVVLRSQRPDVTSNVNGGPVSGSFDTFGQRIALNARGNTLAATTSDGAYVFDRAAAGVWQPPTRVGGAVPDAAVQLSRDGRTMAVFRSGEWGTFGGINPPPGADNPGAPFQGAIYVFTRDAQHAWHLQAHIRADVRLPNEDFARTGSLSADGNRLAASSAGMPALTVSGRIYLFARDATGVWHQETIINHTPPQPVFSENAGNPVLSGNGRVLAVSGGGAVTENFGTAYRFVDVYTLTPQAGWLRQSRLQSKRLFREDDEFGTSVALDGDGTTIAVAAPGDLSDDSDTVGNPDNKNATGSGAVYIFERHGDETWAQQAFIKPRHATTNDQFGRQIGLSLDGRVLLGFALGMAANVPGVNRNNEPDRSATPPDETFAAGAAYVFSANRSGVWTERATVLPPVQGRKSISFFTTELSGDGKTFAIGSMATERTGDVLTQRARVHLY